MSDPELEAAKKRDDYERAEALPRKFHAWGILIKRITPKPSTSPSSQSLPMASPSEPQDPQVEGQSVP